MYRAILHALLYMLKVGQGHCTLTSLLLTVRLKGCQGDSQMHPTHTGMWLAQKAKREWKFICKYINNSNCSY